MNLSENKEHVISKRLETDLKDFLEYHSPAFLGRNIRRMTFLYIRQSLREGLRADLPDFLDQLSDLLDLLETAEEETRDWRVGKV